MKVLIFYIVKLFRFKMGMFLRQG